LENPDAGNDFGELKFPDLTQNVKNALKQGKCRVEIINVAL